MGALFQYVFLPLMAASVVYLAWVVPMEFIGRHPRVATRRAVFAAAFLAALVAAVVPDVRPRPAARSGAGPGAMSAATAA